MGPVRQRSAPDDTPGGGIPLTIVRPSQAPGSKPEPPQADWIPPSRRLDAAARLVGATGPEARASASRFLRNAERHGIDASLMWGVFSAEGPVREVCLAVPGRGSTVTMFLSPANGSGAPARAERAASIAAACEGFAGKAHHSPELFQTLPEPTERWSIDAFADAGFLHVGHLLYLQAPLSPLPEPDIRWPEGLRCVPASAYGQDHRRRLLIQALDRTYRETLDCPELCGLRSTPNILDSHEGAGRYDPSHWWLLMRGEEPVGCALLSANSDTPSMELVYLGLDPGVRGLGLARRMLDHAFAKASEAGVAEITCAVDRRNEPALSLYRSLGFSPFAERVALVRKGPAGG